jgi:hypothetical protein
VTAWKPTQYTELGGYERMLAKHYDPAITLEQRFKRRVERLRELS